MAEIVDIIYHLRLKTHNVQKLDHKVEWGKERTYSDAPWD
jgi:hypothetical protein